MKERCSYKSKEYNSNIHLNNEIVKIQIQNAIMVLKHPKITINDNARGEI